MFNEFLKWALSTLSASTVIALLMYALRGFFSRYFTKAADHHFDKKLEKFKSEIKEHEATFAQVRTFLSSARRERDSALQLKRFEAAEKLLQLRQFLSEFSMAIEYVKMLNIDEVLKKSDDPKVIDFINILSKPFNIDEKLEEYKAIDKTLPRLYLNDDVMNVFDIYESIIVYAVMTLKFLSLSGLNKARYFEEDALGKKILKIDSSHKKGFEEYGDRYALFLASTYYHEILKMVREELLGSKNLDKDMELATRLAIDTNTAQINMRSAIKKLGISDSIIK